MPHSIVEPSQNLGQLLAQQIASQDQKTAIVDGALSLSYAELGRRVTSLALRLLDLGMGNEEPVLVVAPHGTPHIIAQIAVVYVGGTCVPLEPGMSPDEFRYRAELAGACTAIIGDGQTDLELPVKHKVTVENVNDDLSDDSGEYGEILPVEVPPDYRSHIFFTSGSTGKPKGVEVLGRGIMRLRTGILEPTDRVAYVNSVCFDVSMLDIWTTLTLGATAVVVQRDLVLNPEGLAQTLRKHSVTAVLLTATVLNTVVQADPEAFRGFRAVLSSGEAPNIGAMKKILETAAPQHLLNAYGPTECSVLASIHKITQDDVSNGDIPLGQPLEGTELFLADKSLGVVTGPGTGELLIGGRALARGYLDDREKTSQAFVRTTDFGGDKTLYRTGDLVERDNLGRLFWRGRINNEVKHRGYRVQLDDIESEIKQTGLVSSAAVLKIEDSEQASSKLAAGAVPNDPNINRQEVQSRVAERLPHYMVPQVVVLDSMPVKASGKVGKADLETKLTHAKTDDSATNGAGNLSDTEAEIRRIWKRVLVSLDDDNISPDTDLLSFGATSQDVSMAAMMIRKAFDVSFQVRTIFENPSLKQMAAAVDRGLQGHDGMDIEAASRTWLEDAAMGEELAVPRDSPIDWTASSEGDVFVTGVTGFVGAFFLGAILEKRFVRRVRCLVRASSRNEGKKRIFDNLKKYKLLETLEPSCFAKIIPVVGDMSQDRLGLDNEAYMELAGSISVIFHLGAQVNYNQPYSTHRPANILGTLNIMRLATERRVKPLHYSSSIAAFGPTGLIDKTIISEDDSLDPSLKAIPYETGYAQSQWVADKMITTAMLKGLPATVCRMGFVLCDDVTGTGNKDDFMGRLVCDVAALGMCPALPSQRKELLPVRYAVSALMEISLSPSYLGRAYHITPDVDEAPPMDVDDVFCCVGRITGRHITRLPYKEWVDKLQQHNQDAPTRLHPLLPVLYETVLEHKTRWEVYENMARFRNDHVREVLAKANQSHLLCRSGVTEAALGKYLKFLGIDGCEK